MPVGVPKVIFEFSEAEKDDWVDLYNRLYLQRTLFLGQELKAETSTQICGLMIYLSREDKTKELFLFINSPGGGLIPGVAVFDTMQFVEADVNTICLGLACSMASFILAGGEITKRLAFPHARVMIHQPLSSFYENHTGKYLKELAEVMKMRNQVVNSYVERTGQPFLVIYKDLERDSFMSAEEAQAHGVVDSVGLGEKE
uniref:ATP-dependent Clp protease proteolytic subunit n=1 Tax=Silene antirrhina TaxID=54821 RepID=A0A0K1Z747_9CARY|nr:ATP-dependent Clp protease proteolytic subunit [Silene antirrhina]